MVYQKHDFISNIGSYAASGEPDKAKSVLINEIAQLLIYHRGHVISALNESGIKTSKDAPDQELAEKLAENLGSNKALQSAVSLLLANLNSGKAFYSATGCREGYLQKFWGADGTAGEKRGGFSTFLNSLFGQQAQSANTQSPAGTAAGNVAGGAASGGAIGAIAGAINSIFGFAQAKTEAKTEAQSNKMKLAQQILQSKNNQQPAPSKGGSALAWTVAVIALVGVGFVIYKKSQTTA